MRSNNKSKKKKNQNQDNENSQIVKPKKSQIKSTAKK